MGFNLGAGLAEMGRSVAATAGEAALNLQRSELDRQRMELADSLAGERESKGRKEQSLLNAAENEKERAWRSDEATKREEGENARLLVREAGETERSRISNSRMLALHDLSEKAADGRLQKQLDAADKAARLLAKSKLEDRIIESAKDASKVPVQMPYITAEGNQASRTVMVVDPVRVAAHLRDAGHPDLANPYDPKPVKQAPKAEAVARPPALAGMEGLQYNPKLRQFRDGKGNIYDADGKKVKN